MAANSGGSRGGSVFSFDTRQIVVSGIIGGIALFLGATRLGFIPVPIPLIGNATIMHIPAIVGGALEGPVVGLLGGAVFGIFSFLYAEVPLFKDPIVAIVPRLLIGVVAWAVFVSLRRWSIDLASIMAGVIPLASSPSCLARPVVSAAISRAAEGSSASSAMKKSARSPAVMRA